MKAYGYMIRHLKHEEIDRIAWDACIEGSPNRRVYATSSYLDQMHPGWESLVLDDYHAVFPLTPARKFGISYLHTPLFVQQLGTFSRAEPPGELTQRFLAAIPDVFRYIDLNLNVADRPVSDWGSWQLRRNLVLDLSPDYESLEKNYSGNLHRNLRLAGKNAARLELSSDTARLVSMFRAGRGKKLRSIHEDDYRRFEGLMADSLHKGNGSLLVALNPDGEWLAGAFFLKHADRHYFLFSGNSEGGRETAALPRLIDFYIREHAGRREYLDFEGSVQEGLARFYAGFGAKEESYPRVVNNRLPWMIRWMK